MPKQPPEFIMQVKRQAIMAMFSDDELMDRLVLKGGNLLDLVYGISARSSVDIDLSVDGDLGEPDALEIRLAKTLRTTFHEIGYEAFDVDLREVPTNLSPDMKDFWGGYRVAFKIIERAMFEQYESDLEKIRRNAASIGKRGSTKFAIDISKHEYCALKRPYELEHLTIYVYTPVMLICEKLRAICQQMPEYTITVGNHPSARARDFVDIFIVATQYGVDFGTDEVSRVLPRVFAAKRVPVRLLRKIPEYREYHRPDYQAVKATMKPGYDLHDFDYYFDFVVANAARLKPIRDE
jgi:predicted nucleotidyltransferase component of viral defense system